MNNATLSLHVFFSISVFVSGLVCLIVLIPPLKRILFKRHTKTRTTNWAPGSRQLSERQLYELRRHIPTAQLELLDCILMVSLGHTAPLLSDLPGRIDTSKSLFEERVNQIIKLFREIKQLPEMSNSTSTTRSKNNALVSFAFYRVLFHGVIDSAIESGIMSHDSDPWVLLKRIPPKLANYLGSQSWRLYELYKLVFGQLNDVTLNQDLSTQLERLCGSHQPQAQEPTPLRPPTHRPQQRENPEQILPIEETKASTPAEVEPVVSDFFSSLSSENMAVFDRVAEDICQDEPTETPASQACNVSPHIERFFKWLHRQIKRNPINQGDKFFYDAAQFGENHLLIAESALDDFVRKSQVSLDVLKATLIEGGHLENEKIYRLAEAGSDTSPLLRLTMEFSETPPEPTKTIEEMSCVSS